MEFQSIKNDIEQLNKVIKYLPEKEDNIKTIPSIFNRIYDENFISDFLSYVLDPFENGIGFEPLTKVIEDYSEKATNILQKFTVEDKNNIEIIREYSFLNGRRIDILIKIHDELIIAIENKIFAIELENQTDDYSRSIHKEFPNYEYVFLYLTRKGDKPINNEFLPISYETLVKKLKEVKFDYRDDIRRKVIFDEFILHVEEYMMDKKLNTTISEHTRLYLEYQDTIKKLDNYFKEDSDTMFEKFEGMLKSIFHEEEWKFNISKNRDYQIISKSTWDIDGLFIHYEFWISSKNILTKKDIPCYIEVEKRDSSRFLNLFDTEFKKIEDKYIKNDILYRPPNRKIAIGHKSLDNYFRVDYDGEIELAEEIERCEFIEDAVERVYKIFFETKHQI